MAIQKQMRHWSLMRMLNCPARSPFKASKELPGNAARSLIECAASNLSSLKYALCSNPENAFIRLPAANSLVRLSR